MRNFLLYAFTFMLSFVLSMTLMDIFVYEKEYSPVVKQYHKIVQIQPDTTYHIIPLGNVDPVYIEAVRKEIIHFFGFNVKVLPAVPLTDDILTRNKERYDASKILKKFHNKDKKQIILMSKDIAQVRKDTVDVRGNGILGIGFIGRHTCLVSTKRITGNNNERIKKVALHEIGHTLGMEHCKNDICIMRVGSNKNKKESTIKRIDEVKYFFCEDCMSGIKVPYPNKKQHEMLAYGSKNGTFE